MTLKSFYGLLISLLLCLFVSCASLPSAGKTENEKIKYAYKTINVTEKLDYLESDIKYPEFDGFPELNKRISNSILNNWKSFKSYSKTEWNDIIALNNRGSAKLPSFEYLVTYEVSNSNDIISVLINTYIFNGGAHGNTNLAAYNYQVSSSKFINIQQASGMTYNEISSICRNHLYKKLIDEAKSKMPPSEEDSLREMINTGAFPQAGNFEIFMIDDEKVYVYFEPYSVAPYSYGIQKIRVK